jgi:hypothetical protein
MPVLWTLKTQILTQGYTIQLAVTKLVYNFQWFQKKRKFRLKVPCQLSISSVTSTLEQGLLCLSIEVNLLVVFLKETVWTHLLLLLWELQSSKTTPHLSTTCEQLHLTQVRNLN